MATRIYKFQWCPAFVILAVLYSCAHLPAMAQSPFDPVHDDPTLPRMLIIGDSISIGYTLPVRRLLEGKVNVHRIPVNGQYSSFGLEHIKEWLGDGKWDAIHFNWGIWDTHWVDGKGAMLSAADEVIKPGKIRTTITEYQDNLNKLIDVMNSTGAKLIWGTTTPMMCRTGKRRDDIDRYNAAAATVMRARSVAIDDLNTAINPRLSELQAPDGCHFTPKGSAFLGAQVAKSILGALPAMAGQSITWKAEQTDEKTLEGRHVLRFEHDCLEQWGYTQKTRQYFYVVEPKIKSEGPLLVCLHSAGGNPDKFNNGEVELPSNAKSVAEAGDDFTGLVLNSGIDAEWWWGAHEIKANPEKYKQTLTPVEQRVLATVEWVVCKYGIDRNRVYMRGISMGGSGTLGLGMSHGDIFAALQAGVPAGTSHAMHRLSSCKTLNDVPPVLVYFSQKDNWSKGMEDWLAFADRNKLSVLAAWGTWGHLNHYETTNAAAYEFPWLSIRKNQAYPAFTNSSSDDKYPGFQSDAADQNGQMNAYFRWAVLEDQPGRFAVELRLVSSRELGGSVDIPRKVISNVTLRRLQQFEVKTGASCSWRIEQAGRMVHSGLITPDSQRLLTIPRVRITAKPALVIVQPAQ